MSVSNASSWSDAAVRPAALRAWYWSTTRSQSPVASLLSTCHAPICLLRIGDPPKRYTTCAKPGALRCMHACRGHDGAEQQSN